jgi:hypothetical protein
MNSNTIVNYPDLSNYYKTISYINTEEDINSTNTKNNKINIPNSTKNSDMKLNRNSFAIDNKRISFKNIEDIPINTGESTINANKNEKTKLGLYIGKNGTLLNSNNSAKNKNILLNKKNQQSQKIIRIKNDLVNVTSNFQIIYLNIYCFIIMKYFVFLFGLFFIIYYTIKIYV